MLEKLQLAADQLCDRVESAQSIALTKARKLAREMTETGASIAELEAAMLSVTEASSNLEQVYGESISKWNGAMQKLAGNRTLLQAFRESSQAEQLNALVDKQVYVQGELHLLRRQLLEIVDALP